MHEDSTPEEVADRSLMMDILGYDPRFLLTDQTALTDLYDALTLRGAVENLSHGYFSNMFKYLSDDEMIDFDPLYRDETIIFVDPAGDVVDEKTTRVPFERKLTPFVAPLGTGRYRPRDPDMIEVLPARQQGKTYVIGHGRLVFDDPITLGTEAHQAIDRLARYRATFPVLPGFWAGLMPDLARWGEADTNPLADIQNFIDGVNFGTDFSSIEERVLRTLEGKKDRQMDLYRLAALYERTPPPEEPKKQNGRSAAYLRHDKTKQHRRRKRK